jgi:hypothetical protein
LWKVRLECPTPPVYLPTGDVGGKAGTVPKTALASGGTR